MEPLRPARALHRAERDPARAQFLRDLGWDASKFIRSRHADHKLGAIETLLEFYPRLRFILIGDSGQHDAVIYREVVRRHPGRILAVYIRELARHSARGSAARAELDAVRASGVEAVLCPTLLRAADHAAAQGWIAAPAVQAVQAEVSRSRPAPPERRAFRPGGGVGPQIMTSSGLSTQT